jgi:ectoine hydroxylase-related dioxygenase (phytanoyl-CoA dioxygenase family)
MNQQQWARAVCRRGFLKAACAAPTLGFALHPALETVAAEPGQSSGEVRTPRTDEELKAELDEYGFVVIEELIPRADALRAEKRVKEIMSRQRDAAKPDQHLPGFLNHIEPNDDPLILPLVTQQVCLKLARALLGDGFQMTEVGCRWRKPGSPAGETHVTRPLDSLNRSGLPMPNVCFVLAFSWMLNDLTRDMGATYYLPFSQHAPQGPRAGITYRHRVEIEAPAGSVLVHHSGLWHGFAANTTKDKARVGLMGGYFPAWMDPVAVGWQPMKRSVRDRMPESVRQMNHHSIDG